MSDSNGQRPPSPQLAALLDQHYQASRPPGEPPALGAVPPAIPPNEVTLSLGLDAATHTMVLGFGTLVAWIALTAAEARALAAALLEHADRLDPTPTEEKP